MAKRLGKRTSAKQTSDATSKVTEPTTIDREEMKRRLGKAKKTAAKQTSDKTTSAKRLGKRASAKQTSDKQSTEGQEMDLRTIQTAMEQMLSLVLNTTKELDALVARVTELEQSASVIDNVVKVQSEVCANLGYKIGDLTALVEDALEGDEDEYEDEDEGQDEDEDEAADDCEEDDGEDDCEEGEEIGRAHV